MPSPRPADYRSVLNGRGIARDRIQTTAHKRKPGDIVWYLGKWHDVTWDGSLRPRDGGAA